MTPTKLATIIGAVEVAKNTEIGKQILNEIIVRGRNLEIFLGKLIDHINKEDI